MNSSTSMMSMPSTPQLECVNISDKPDLFLLYLQSYLRNPLISITKLTLKKTPVFNPTLLNVFKIIFNTLCELSFQCDIPDELAHIITIALTSVDSNHLTRLELSKAQMSPQVFNAFLQQLPPPSTGLQLYITDNSYHPDFLLNHPNLVALDLSRNTFVEESVRKLSSLISCTTLQRLILDQVTAQDQIGIDLIKLIMQLPVLETLSLRSFYFTQAKFDALLTYLKENSTLKHLDLTDCHLPPNIANSMNQLVTTVRDYNLTLKTCTLSTNSSQLNALLQRNKKRPELEAQRQAAIQTQSSIRSLKDTPEQGESPDTLMTQTQVAERRYLEGLKQVQALAQQQYPSLQAAEELLENYKQGIQQLVILWLKIGSLQQCFFKTAFICYESALHLFDQHAQDEQGLLYSIFHDCIARLSALQRMDMDSVKQQFLNQSLEAASERLQTIEKTHLQNCQQCSRLFVDRSVLTDRQTVLHDHKIEGFLPLIETWHLLGRNQCAFLDVQHCYENTLRLFGQHVKTDQVLLNRLFSDYITQLLHIEETSRHPFQNLETALLIAAQAYRRNLPDIPQCLQMTYQQYFSRLCRFIEQTQPDQIQQHVDKALRLMREARDQYRMNTLCPYAVQLVQYLHSRPEKSLSILRQALKVAKFARELTHNDEDQYAVRTALEKNYFLQVVEVSRQIKEKQNIRVAIDWCHRLRGIIHAIPSQECQQNLQSIWEKYDETVVFVAQRFMESQGYHQRLLELLQSVSPHVRGTDLIRALQFDLAKRYLQERLLELITAHCGTFDNLVSRFPKALGNIQVNIKMTNSLEDLIYFWQQFLRESEATYSRRYWHKLFTELENIEHFLASIQTIEHQPAAPAPSAPPKEIESAAPEVSREPTGSHITHQVSLSYAVQPSAPLIPQKEDEQNKQSVIPEEDIDTPVGRLLTQIRREKIWIDESTIPSEFIDTITSQLMADPVFAMDGHTYDHQTLKNWFKRKATSPLTSEPIDTTIKQNHDLRGRMIEFFEEIIQAHRERLSQANLHQPAAFFFEGESASDANEATDPLTRMAYQNQQT
jgi:hypothetical protein